MSRLSRLTTNSKLTCVQVRCSCDMLYKWTVDDLTDGKLPDASSKLIYERTARSRFVGTYVFVWRRGEDSLAVREAKGSYAFVLDVDQERSMARISYQNREAILPLKSLVSLCVVHIVKGITH